MVVENKPYKEKNMGDYFIREFSVDVDSNEYGWHRDKEDRTVISLNETDWLIQLDNELPKSLNEEVFIPKNVYHRVIKGVKNNLKIKLIKHG